MGEDRALVRLGAPPRRLRHRVGAAGAAARQRAHRRAAGAGGLLPQAEALERPGGARWPATPSASRSRSRGSTSCWRWPTPTRRRSATPTQAMDAYQRALDADERCIDAINALERLYRRTQAWDRLVDVLAKKSQVVDDTEQAIRLKLQVGELWEDRLGDNDRAVEAYKEVLSVDPRNLPALTALDAPLREDRAHGGVPREPRAPARGLAARGGPRRHLPEDGDDLGRELRQARSRHRGAGEDPPHRRSQREGLPRSRAPLSARAQVGVAGRDLPQAPRASPATRPSGSSSTPRWGRSTRQELRDLDRAIDAYNDVLSVEADHPDALAGLARLYEETEQWERAVEMMRRLLRVSADPKQKVDLNYRLGKIFDEQMKEPEPAQEYLVEALSQDPAHVPSMLSLLGDLQAARRLAEGGAADGPRRGGHRQPAGEDAPPVRGGQDLPGEARRRGAGRRSVRARACSSIPSTSRPPSRCRSSTSSARSGRRWCRCSRCWRARRIARPTAS